jgi:hypothetical protein
LFKDIKKTVISESTTYSGFPNHSYQPNEVNENMNETKLNDDGKFKAEQPQSPSGSDSTDEPTFKREEDIGVKSQNKIASH